MASVNGFTFKALKSQPRPNGAFGYQAKTGVETKEASDPIVVGLKIEVAELTKQNTEFQSRLSGLEHLISDVMGPTVNTLVIMMNNANDRHHSHQPPVASHETSPETLAHEDEPKTPKKKSMFSGDGTRTPIITIGVTEFPEGKDAEMIVAICEELGMKFTNTLMNQPLISVVQFYAVVARLGAGHAYWSSKLKSAFKNHKHELTMWGWYVQEPIQIFQFKYPKTLGEI